jgi:hypothetical protein
MEFGNAVPWLSIRAAGDLGSLLGQSMCHLFWREWHSDRCLSDYSCTPPDKCCSFFLHIKVSLHYVPVFTFFSISLFLSLTLSCCYLQGRTMSQAVIRRTLTAKTWVQCQASPFVVEKGHSDMLFSVFFRFLLSELSH